VETATSATGTSGAAVIRAQILLDRARFSPGEIDGKFGEDLAIAIKCYQGNHGLKTTGTVDAETWAELNKDTAPLTSTYTITLADLKGPFGPLPKDVQERAKMKWLGYESLEEELSEKFHESPALLAQLNPGKKFDVAGERIIVPNVTRSPAPRALRVVVSKSQRTVTAMGAGDKILAVYPATLGGEHDPLPIGTWTIVGVVPDPWFYYQPERFWNANPNEATAKLPPGPRNPAGRVWMGLSKPHYGIHGSPEPGHIRHDSSYGCIRLTNWDIVDLSHMVRRGTPAIFEE
jgi:lipoprotein-anchoring transpeptidase ErfK/SrfK